MQQDQKIPSVLTVEQNKKITLTCVNSVDSFSDTAIRLTVNGQKVNISGNNLTVLTFSQGTGNFIASGEVDAVKFGGKSFKSLLK